MNRRWMAAAALLLYSRRLPRLKSIRFYSDIGIPQTPSSRDGAHLRMFHHFSQRHVPQVGPTEGFQRNCSSDITPPEGHNSLEDDRDIQTR